MSDIYSLKLHSADRSAGTLRNPSFVLPEQITDIKGVKIKSAMVPVSNYTFDSRNNKIYFTEATTSNLTYAATIIPGIYNITNITSAVASALSTTGSFTYTVNYFSTTNSLQISATSGNFSFQTGANHANFALGITDSDLTTMNTSKNLSAPVDLSGIKEVNVVSNIPLTEVFRKNYSVLCTIPITEGQNNISYYFDNGSDYIKTDIASLSEIRLQFFDERFRSLDLNQDYSLTINFLTEQIRPY